ncbi:proline iminopeptidase-family hydrolase [Planomicrobium sp. CPCC 101079]|uniref:proline iminopeptidase-family hydrolase n=1 Tax=Planomicrobium sp. CPCC 101079 TaxID=2599618 RepID=UPI0011B7B01B|nr:proline iminopeptidase-family hydrolase [Planomicrobium sp. CPCC 101079]TWT00499.1 alpha/beta fold hydrolase [Planomicrobium sp. CPCC 101079]
MEHVTEGFIQVTGGKVWYRITGDGSGIPLLVLHGGPGGKSSDKDPLRNLGNERSVIQYDQLGCGNSERPNDLSLWTVERYVEELGQVREALGLDEVHILGHSWGTMLASSYLLTKPAGVQSIIFSGPALRSRMWEQDQRTYLKQFPQKMQDIIEHHEREETTEAKEYQDAMYTFYKRHVCRLDPWPADMIEEFEKMNQQIYNYMWGASEFTVTGTLQDFDVTAKLEGIGLPALFTCGRYDEATPETTAYYASLLPGAEYFVFENCSHTPGEEDPNAYESKIREFLNRQERRTGEAALSRAMP